MELTWDAFRGSYETGIILQGARSSVKEMSMINDRGGLPIKDVGGNHGGITGHRPIPLTSPNPHLITQPTFHVKSTHFF